jgi:hypothetical protein
VSVRLRTAPALVASAAVATHDRPISQAHVNRQSTTRARSLLVRYEPGDDAVDGHEHG